VKILITGGHGFIAYNLFQWMRRNQADAKIWLFDHRYGQDILNYNQLEKAVEGMDFVFHLAACTHVDYSIDGPMEDRQRFIDVNHKGTWNVLEACRKHKVKLVHVSTSEVYGSNMFPGKPMTEDHPLNPDAGTYAVSKCAADHECRVAYEVFGQDVVIIRPFNQYGPHQSTEKLIPRLIKQATYGEPLTIHGTGDQKRDYVYAEDTASAMWAIKDLPAGTIVNIGTENAYSINEIADLVVKSVETKFPSIKVYTTKDTPRPNDLAELRGSYKKINELCGWEPQVTLEEGIAKCVDWYTSNGYILPPEILNKG
jgi:nucleoside-diphosphate-sugar epimerase